MHGRVSGQDRDGRVSARSGSLRFAPVRSFGFRMPCRERAVELVKGGECTGDVREACARRRSRFAYATRRDSSQPVQLRKPGSQIIAWPVLDLRRPGLVRLASVPYEPHRHQPCRTVNKEIT
jgi:hypothetical protein